MKQFNVSGMSCAACSSRVEKAVSSLPGVSSCSVSLLTNSMGVEGSVDDSAIIKAVEEAGYGASIKGREAKKEKYENALEDKETPLLKQRLISSLLFLIVLMYFSMGHSMAGLPVPAFFVNNPIAMALIQMILALAVMVVNQKFFISGFKGALHKSPNMDTLVAMGSAAGFLYSIAVLFQMTLMDRAEAMHHLHDLYFEASAMILALITVGKMLEARSKGRTTDALKSLMKLAPQTAVVIKDGNEVEVSIDEVVKDDIFIVRPGESIPVDGIILEGESAINESALTGESIPVDKIAGDKVFSATINQSGFIKCKAVRVGEDTTLSQIIAMVSDAAATKAPIAKIADKVSGVFVPAVIAIAVATFAIWLLVGESFGFAIARGISVLVISCPCALGLATPVAIMVGNGVGAKNGILFKTAESLETAGRTEIVALDKTGTITKGEPAVKGIYPETMDEISLLKLVAALEKHSEHPLARAIIRKAEELSIEIKEADSLKVLPGNGLTAIIHERKISGGNADFISKETDIPLSSKKVAEELAGKGETPLYFSYDGTFIGMISVSDPIKEDSKKAIAELKNMGIKTVMITGDNPKTAKAIAAEAGIDMVYAGVLPDGKEKIVKELMADGKTMMVGDGINDAPALTRADSGVAIGAGTDVAIDAADIVLMKSSLEDVPALIRLSRATIKNIHENLFWAFSYNLVGIPLAAGAFISILGWKMNPMFGALAMSFSSFFVVTNALRLNLFDIRSTKHDKKLKEKTRKEIKKMTKTMKIEGMMCKHCEARVKKTLEAIDGVESAEVSFEAGSAVVTLSKEVEDALLKAEVEAQDYPVLSIE